MTDRELLEMVAKAAGLSIIKHQQDARDHAGYGDIGLYVADASGRLIHTAWNPLTHDGDALRLAVRMWIEIRVFNGKVYAGKQGEFWCTELCNEDAYAATRRAIVRAAAKIGKSME